MKIAIADANIFIDLHYLGMLDRLFLLGYDIYTPMAVLDELDDEQLKPLKIKEENGSLTVHTMNSKDDDEIIDLDFPNGTSLTDRTLYYFSQKIDSVVLTGEKKLRDIIKEGGCEVYGVVWLFDQWVKGEEINKDEAVKMLQNLIEFNPFLPIEECQQKINQWLN